MFKNYILVHLNGQPFNCFSDMSLKDLLTYLNFDVSSVIIEYNYEIVSINSLHDILISPNDKIEVLTMVGGG